MMKFKNVLDERQEAEMLKIERNGCWFAFWGLLIAILVQTVMGTDGNSIIGEWIVFMALALYISIACMHKGIWARSYKPSFAGNLITSLITGIVCAALVFITAYLRKPEAVNTCLILGSITGVFMFVMTLIALSIAASAVKKKVAALEKEPEDENL